MDTRQSIAYSSKNRMSFAGGESSGSKSKASAGYSSHSTDKYSQAATSIQGSTRGVATRRSSRIKTVAPGVIHTRVRGNEETFSKIGMNIDPRRDDSNQSIPRNLDVLSIDSSRYSSSMVGGHSLFNPISADNQTRRDVLGSSRHNVYVDGGYFNAGERHSGHPSHRPIGPTSTLHTSSYIPTPSKYESDYEKIVGDDGTYISSAPVLGREGKNVFPRSKLDESKFNYETVRSGKATQLPGELYHMSDPNPRAGISFSSKNREDNRSNSSSKQNRTRIAAATTVRERGPKNDGFTMAEWSNVMNRLSGININPGDAINLDSGKSVVIGITDQHGDRTFTVAQEKRGRDASTMASFRSKDR